MFEAGQLSHLIPRPGTTADLHWDQGQGRVLETSQGLLSRARSLDLEPTPQAMTSQGSEIQPHLHLVKKGQRVLLQAKEQPVQKIPNYDWAWCV